MRDLMDTAYWLSVEDHIMASPPKTSGKRYLLLWRVKPCIVIGKNQIAEAEIDLAEAARRNIAITRRGSGGGAVYQDPGSIQYSVIQPHSNKYSDDAMKIAREQVAECIAGALRKFGVAAVAEGRNDITVNGAKVSGLSQLARGGWLNTHGTLLYDADLEILSKLLIPDSEKYLSKAVRSVRKRVANVRPMITVQLGTGADSVESFVSEFENAVREDASAHGRPFAEFRPAPGDIANIMKIREEIYTNPANIFESSPPYTFRNARRFPQGRIEFFAEVKGGIVASCAIRGDFIGAITVDALERALTGAPFQSDAFSVALCGDIVKNALGGLEKADFLDLLFGH